MGQVGKDSEIFGNAMQIEILAGNSDLKHNYFA
jgi:hypothetical protein